MYLGTWFKMCQFTGESLADWCRRHLLLNHLRLWSCSPFSISCACSGTRSWSASQLDRAREQFQSSFASSSTCWNGTPFPIPAFDIACRFVYLSSSLKKEMNNQQWIKRMIDFCENLLILFSIFYINKILLNCSNSMKREVTQRDKYRFL